MSVDHPGLLWLLPLALLPLLAWPGRRLAHPSAASMPPDAASVLLHALLRLAAAAALAALVVGLAGPHQPEYPVKRFGKGAEIVLVLDRSRSMDQSFGGARPQPGGTRSSKGKVARQVLSEFAAGRPADRFGMIVFSTLPIRVLEFTHKPQAIQAAIAAGDIGRGLSETDIGLALQSALSYFEDRPYTGSRLILLVSDGGDHIDPDSRTRIAQLASRHRVGLTWIYIRSANSRGLRLDGDEPPANADTVPEYFLHGFFQSLGTPYRAYEAEDAEALRRAVEDVDRLENLPITYFDTVPRREWAPSCFAAALGAVLLLLAASLTEIRRWS